MFTAHRVHEHRNEGHREEECDEVHEMHESGEADDEHDECDSHDRHKHREPVSPPSFVRYSERAAGLGHDEERPDQDGKPAGEYPENRVEIEEGYGDRQRLGQVGIPPAAGL